MARCFDKKSRAKLYCKKKNKYARKYRWVYSKPKTGPCRNHWLVRKAIKR